LTFISLKLKKKINKIWKKISKNYNNLKFKIKFLYLLKFLNLLIKSFVLTKYFLKFKREFNDKFWLFLDSNDKKLNKFNIIVSYMGLFYIKFQ
jgi:hypothetical protein